MFLLLSHYCSPRARQPSSSCIMCPQIHGLSSYWSQSDASTNASSNASSNATGYEVPSLLCCVVQSKDTVHVLASSFSPHLQPERRERRRGRRGSEKEEERPRREEKQRKGERRDQGGRRMKSGNKGRKEM